ncbi:MAG: hypothetical protein OXI94_10620 [Gemmatimonadota bacterium]|nr:hypothetical protein [Gemmatimonadota bacterium]
MFEQAGTSADTEEVEIEGEDGTHHRFRYVNKVSLNGSNKDLKVNFLEYHETKPGTKKQPESKTIRFSWVTDIQLNRNNLMKVMRAGRARWRIENETFNTLKNQGYHFEHNFGHGNKHLASVFGNLMVLAFLIDQIEAHCCRLFQAAFGKMGRLRYLREKDKEFFPGHDYSELGSSLPEHSVWSRGSFYTEHFVGMLIIMSGTGKKRLLYGAEEVCPKHGDVRRQTLKFRCDAEKTVLQWS